MNVRGGLAFGAANTAVLEHVPGDERVGTVAIDRVALFIVQGGSLQIPSRDEVLTIPDGHGAVVIGAAAVSASSKHGCRTTVVDVPLATLDSVALPERSLFVVEQPTLLRPFVRFIQTMHSGDAPPAESRPHIEQMLQGMVGAAVSTVIAVDAPRASLLAQATQIIRRRCSEPTLTPDLVAGELNVSLRHLEREFQRAGCTIRRAIRRIRVARAVTMLNDDGDSPCTIDVIAVQAGFSNGSSLARAMAAEGHPSPSVLRAEARSAAADRGRDARRRGAGSVLELAA